METAVVWVEVENTVSTSLVSLLSHIQTFLRPLVFPLCALSKQHLFWGGAASWDMGLFL